MVNIFKLFKGAKFDYDQIKGKMISGIEISNFFVSDHLKQKNVAPCGNFRPVENGLNSCF